MKCSTGHAMYLLQPVIIEELPLHQLVFYSTPIPQLVRIWFLDKTVLLKICGNGTLLMTQLMQNSSTNTYIN